LNPAESWRLIIFKKCGDFTVFISGTVHREFT
jgi:hypothetical protein